MSQHRRSWVAQVLEKSLGKSLYDQSCTKWPELVDVITGTLDIGESVEGALLHGYQSGLLIVTSKRLLAFEEPNVVVAHPAHRLLRSVQANWGFPRDKLIVKYADHQVSVKAALFGPTGKAFVETLQGKVQAGAEAGPAPGVEGAEATRPRVARRTLTVHALGSSGSGKTVFMASLYERLRLRRQEFAFYVKTDLEHSAHLNTVYNSIVDTDKDWPAATQDPIEWRFTTCIRSKHGDFEPLDFCYLDYPGGVLTNPRAYADRSLKDLVDRLESANALLILLDGEAMLALMHDEPKRVVGEIGPPCCGSAVENPCGEDQNAGRRRRHSIGLTKNPTTRTADATSVSRTTGLTPDRRGGMRGGRRGSPRTPRRTPTARVGQLG